MVNDPKEQDCFEYLNIGKEGNELRFSWIPMKISYYHFNRAEPNDYSLSETIPGQEKFELPN